MFHFGFLPTCFYPSPHFSRPIFCPIARKQCPPHHTLLYCQYYPVPTRKTALFSAKRERSFPNKIPPPPPFFFGNCHHFGLPLSSPSKWQFSPFSRGLTRKITMEKSSTFFYKSFVQYRSIRFLLFND